MPVSSRHAQGSHVGRKRIGVHQYHNITPVSALETLDQVHNSEAVRSILIRGVCVDTGVQARVISMSRSWTKTDGTSVLGTGPELMFKGLTKETLQQGWARRRARLIPKGCRGNSRWVLFNQHVPYSDRENMGRGRRQGFIWTNKTVFF